MGYLLKMCIRDRANAVQNEQAIQGIKMFLSFLPAVGTVLSVAFIKMCIRDRLYLVDGNADAGY